MSMGDGLLTYWLLALLRPYDETEEWLGVLPPTARWATHDCPAGLPLRRLRWSGTRYSYSSPGGGGGYHH